MLHPEKGEIKRNRKFTKCNGCLKKFGRSITGETLKQVNGRLKCARLLPSQQSSAKTVKTHLYGLWYTSHPRSSHPRVTLAELTFQLFLWRIGLLHDLVSWYKINYVETQVTQWDFQNKGKSSLATSSRVFAHSQSPLSLGGKNKLSLWRSQFQHNLFLPCDRIVKRAYSTQRNTYNCAFEYLTRVKNTHGAKFDTVSRQAW